jgi:hypothetical protein
MCQSKSVGAKALAEAGRTGGFDGNREIAKRFSRLAASRENVFFDHQ